MSFTITLFGPKHYLWEWNQINSWDKTPRTWFHRSDSCSKGSVGFCIPGVHMNFTWVGKK